MTVLLRTSRDLQNVGAYDRWLAIGLARSDLDPVRAVDDIADRLERSYDGALNDWQMMAPALAHGAGANYAHMPACAPNASDFGEMLAWSRLVDDIAAHDEQIVAVCDDPWLFRHLARRPNVVGGRPPALGILALRHMVRGYLARFSVSIRVIVATLRLRGQRSICRRGTSAILVYGHPTSDADGQDGYFGDLMKLLPSLGRVLHVDCPSARAAELARDGRTVSLHAWGCLRRACLLAFAKWRPSKTDMDGPYEWLIRRAATLEGGTGQAAMIRWQHVCQARWIVAIRPRVVAWPWENHAWERAFVRFCAAAGVHTVGYQHATIGHYETNYSFAANGDGLASIPQTLVTNGPAGRATLGQLGYPSERICVGGALRYVFEGGVRYETHAPFFFALPADPRIAAEMLDAARAIAATGGEVFIRAHPMTPFDFTETIRLKRAPGRLTQCGPLAGVVYAGTTVGLEARLMGLPTLRFKPSYAVANDIIPSGMAVAAAAANRLTEVLATIRPSPPIDPRTVFSAPDDKLWARLLDGAQT